MPSDDHWGMADIDAEVAALGARWRGLEALNDAARKFLAHVAGIVRDDVVVWFDDIPEVLAMKAALRAIDESENGTSGPVSGDDAGAGARDDGTME